MNKNNNNPILYRMCVGTAIGATFGVVSEHPILGRKEVFYYEKIIQYIPYVFGYRISWWGFLP